jgi:hypothetical protein
MAALKFTIAPDLHFSKTVEDDARAQQQLELFTKGHMPYAQAWVEVDNGVWIRRDAVLAVRIAGEPGVAFG